MDRYRPPHPENWQGRADEAPKQRIHQAVELIDLSAEGSQLPEGAVAIVGFVCDEGIKRNHGRVGAAEGPSAIRLALGKLPLPRADITIVDAGDVVCLDNDLESSQRALGDVVALLLERGCLPIILGGGHEQAWGIYQGVKQAGLHKGASIVNFDAHYDIRPLIDDTLGSSGTSFLQIANDRADEGLPFRYFCVGIQENGNTIVAEETAERLGVQKVTAATLNAEGVEGNIQHLQRGIAGGDRIHLSICMDVFAAAHAPGVSAPQPLGITPWQAIPLLQAVISSGKLMSIEVAEVSPPHDVDGMTSRLAANLIATMMRGIRP